VTFAVCLAGRDRRGRLPTLHVKGPVTDRQEIRNHLLAALVAREYQHLLPRLERVELSLAEVVYEAESQIQYVHFPETAVVSLLSTLEDGATTEVGLIGREGMVGLGVFLGGSITHDQAVVLAAGSAVRMRASALREELRLGSPLQPLLLRYTRAFLALVTQSVVCGQHHTVGRRFARWLLMVYDHVGPGELRLTHELIAAIMGVRRPGVTEAAGALKGEGLIKYRRGRITILDRRGLEARACECYAIIRDEYGRLHANQIPSEESASRA
jgi:CRP-like cAMP-binding protein